MSTPRLRVTAVWYEQSAPSHERLGLASITLKTDLGHFSRTVPVSAESLAEAERIAERLGAHFCVGHSLRGAA